MSSRGSDCVFIKLEIAGDLNSYKITIKGDGAVLFENEDGIRSSTKITRARLKELVDEFYKQNFFGLKDDYSHASFTDADTIILQAVINGRTKQIRAYMGNFEELEDIKHLRAIEEKICIIAEVDKWIKFYG